MSEFQGTPGPWAAVCPRIRWRIMAGEKFVMETDEVRNEADAHLIAAAPDLLAACEAVLAGDPDGRGLRDEVLRQVVDAVAKAMGK